MYHSTTPVNALNPIGIKLVNDKGQTYSFAAGKADATQPSVDASVRPLSAYADPALAAYSFAAIPPLDQAREWSLFEVHADGSVYSGPYPVDFRKPTSPEVHGVFSSATCLPG